MTVSAWPDTTGENCMRFLSVMVPMVIGRNTCGYLVGSDIGELLAMRSSGPAIVTNGREGNRQAAFGVRRLSRVSACGRRRWLGSAPRAQGRHVLRCGEAPRARPIQCGSAGAVGPFRLRTTGTGGVRPGEGSSGSISSSRSSRMSCLLLWKRKRRAGTVSTLEILFGGQAE